MEDFRAFEVDWPCASAGIGGDGLWSDIICPLFEVVVCGGAIQVR